MIDYFKMYNDMIVKELTELGTADAAPEESFEATDEELIIDEKLVEETMRRR